MQTFLPDSNFHKAMAYLDDKRLGKQRVEALQVYRALTVEDYGWKNHPAVKMWKGYLDALAFYHNCAILEWKRRGKVNNMILLSFQSPIEYPYWLGDERLHSSHRSNLLRKDFGFYNRFGWAEPTDIPYYWPEGK